MPDRWELGPKGQRLIEEDGAIVIKLSDEQVKMLVGAVDRYTLVSTACQLNLGSVHARISDPKDALNSAQLLLREAGRYLRLKEEA